MITTKRLISFIILYYWNVYVHTDGNFSRHLDYCSYDYIIICTNGLENDQLFVCDWFLKKLRVNWFVMRYNHLVQIMSWITFLINSNKPTNKTTDKKLCLLRKTLLTTTGQKHELYSAVWNHEDIQSLSNTINRHATEHLFSSWRAWHLVWCRQVSSAAGWLTDAGWGP